MTTRAYTHNCPFKGDRAAKWFEIDGAVNGSSEDVLGFIASKIPQASGALVIVSFDTCERAAATYTFGDSMDGGSFRAIDRAMRDHVEGRPADSYETIHRERARLLDFVRKVADHPCASQDLARDLQTLGDDLQIPIEGFYGTVAPKNPRSGSGKP